MRNKINSLKGFLPILSVASMFNENNDFIGVPELKKKYEKKAHKCLLPSCNNMTIHNGGYCCAEHFKEHNKK